MKPTQLKVLVTGATGMLGSCLAMDLAEKGFNVNATYYNESSLTQFKRNINYYKPKNRACLSAIKWHRADIFDKMSLARALKRINYVYHAAALISFNKDDTPRMFETNVRGTQNLIDASLDSGVSRFCHVSSVSTLNTKTNNPIDETCSWLSEVKHSNYSISKYYSEKAVFKSQAKGLNFVIVNPSIILGPGKWTEGSSALFRKIHHGLAFYPSGGTGFVDVSDVSKAILLLSEDKNWQKACGKRYILNAANLSYFDFFNMMALALGVRHPKLKATKLVLSIACRLAHVYGKLWGNKPLLTDEIVLNASDKNCYCGQSIAKEYGFEYKSIQKTIHDIAQMYLSYVKENDKKMHLIH